VPQQVAASRFDGNREPPPSPARSVAARDAPAAVGHALDLIGLSDRAHESVSHFSIGCAGG
jgi:hypothetical protein